MNRTVTLNIADEVATVTLIHHGKFNAMSRVMWRELRTAFERIQQHGDVRCVLMLGEGGHFSAGGDISEYVDFRFEEARLREFHESYIWGGLKAMLECDVPIVAQIEGNCMGAGVEMASCCDVRIAAASARCGAPIAKLGFPMAPREAALVMRAVGELTAREMLLSAAVFDAAEMKQRGFLSQVVPVSKVSAAALERVARIIALAPQAARMNKACLRVLASALPAQRATDLTATAYDYADSAEHREGIAAFMEKRTPEFSQAGAAQAVF
jgi:enoyl-CoA hydratase/carnithine racemase